MLFARPGGREPPGGVLFDAGQLPMQRQQQDGGVEGAGGYLSHLERVLQGVAVDHLSQSQLHRCRRQGWGVGDLRDGALAADRLEQI